jgi:hypothetical protein
MRFILLCLLFAFHSHAQNFTYKVKSYANGEQAPMKGVPGDIFMSTLTFSNSSSSDIFIYINRYEKSIPAYWRSCYCYTVCSDPITDTITVYVPGLSSTDITVQFKTDSVNPGHATSAFRIDQIGISNQTQTLTMDATTLGGVGLTVNDMTRGLRIFPNPATQFVEGQAGEDVRTVSVFDTQGRCAAEGHVDGKHFRIDSSALPPGIYFVKIITGSSVQTAPLVVEK